MKKEIEVVLLFVFVAILTSTFVSASFKYNGEGLIRNYIGGDELKGYINLSFDDENADSIFRSNFDDNGTKLLDLLQKEGFVEGIHYNCSNVDCQNVFKTKEDISSLTLSSTKTDYIGLKLTGKDVSVVDASFRLSSSSSPSCSPGFSISILGNDSVKIQGNSYNDVPCGGKIRGCFDESSGDYDMAIIGNTPYCQRIELPSSPAFRIGAKVKNSSINSKLTMRLFDDNWEALGNCILPKNTQESQDLSCIVNFSSTLNKDYYVCIESDNSNAGYQIESEVDDEICGNSGLEFSDFERDYNIFAQPLQYNPQNITVSSDSLENSIGQNLVDYLNDYLEEKYSNNCDGECVIPFKIDSQVDQTISLSDINFKYESSGAILTNNKIYLLEENKAKIDSKGLKINVENADIYLPISSSNNELQLYLDNEPIFSKKIKLNFTSSFSFDISPKIVPFAIETNFFILSKQNITHSKWTFGDGQVKESPTTFVDHAYIKEGEFNVTVEVTNSKNVRSIKTFKIVVGNVTQSLDKLVNQSENKISSLSRSIDNFEPWIKEELLSIENLSDYISTLNTIKSEIDKDHNNSDISLYVSELYTLDIPRSLNYTDIGKLPLDVGYNSIDSAYTIALSSNECSPEDSECLNYDWVDTTKVNDYLIYWNSENFNSDISYKTISRYSDDGIDPILTYFHIEVKQKNQGSETKYLIIPYPIDSIKFKNDYGAVPITGDSEGVAIPITGNENIEFLVKSQISPVELGAFASPNIQFIVDELKIEPSCKDNPGLPECEKRSGFWFYLLLALGFLVVYVILQEWYKRRYEGYLFPNRDDLYNIINYIHNSRISGMRNEQIANNLSGMKWKKEQMTYAFKKIDGKRTGMWEIPIFKFFENRKVRKEIEKRKENDAQNSLNGGNARFFNGPR